MTKRPDPDHTRHRRDAETKALTAGDTTAPASNAPAPATPADAHDVAITAAVREQLAAIRSGNADAAKLNRLETKVTKAVRRSRSKSTLDAYRSDWNDFCTWCQTLKLNPLPADPATVAAYLADLSDPDDNRSGLAASTLRRRMVSISQYHQAADHPNPCTNPLVKQTMRGIRNTIGVAPKRKEGLSTADIRAIVTTLDGNRLLDIRDKAVLLIGFATAMRRSELVTLTVEDIANHPKASSSTNAAPKPTKKPPDDTSKSHTATTQPPAQSAPTETGSTPPTSQPDPSSEP